MDTLSDTERREASGTGTDERPCLRALGRVVVKVGSALLVDEASGEVRRPWLDALVDDLAALRAAGVEVVLVSSGAIALGRRSLRLARRPLRLDESQAAAAVGQIRLAHAWQESLSRHGATVAQLLLSLGDTEQRRRWLNARGTLNRLLRLDAVPVINENDTVATEEIRFGDNDRLAARVAEMAAADALVLLSDVDGLYSADPNVDPSARLVERVEAITPEIEAMAGAATTAVGTGGMVTKLAAARICLAAGCHMAIVSGHERNPLARLEDGARATWFVAGQSPRTARKNWIAASLKPRGVLHVDAGAVAALARGTSLLPAGVTAVDGRFARGDAVLVMDGEGREIARGLAAYGADDARRIVGQKSSAIAERLGYRGRDEIIHRDDLVLTREPTP